MLMPKASEAMLMLYSWVSGNRPGIHRPAKRAGKASFKWAFDVRAVTTPAFSRSAVTRRA